MKEYISWEQFHKDTKSLCEKLKSKDVKGILAVARGGLVPAAIISSEIGCRLIDTISVASYNNQSQHDLTCLKPATLPDRGSGYLIVDDLVDTGITAKYVKGWFSEALFVSVYAKPSGLPHADLYGKEYPQDRWLVFPWE